MPDDDNGGNSPRGLVGLALSKGGWFSGACVALWGFTGIIFDLLPTQDTRLERINTDLGHIFLGMAIVSLAFKLKHGTDMIARSEAEKRIADPALPTASKDPAIQREIAKQLTEPPPAPAVNAFLAAERKTPLMGTPIQRG